MVVRAFCAVAVLLSTCGVARAVDPWADHVVSYNGGTLGSADYVNPLTALGSPERFTGETGGFPAAVSPFNPVWGTDEMVNIGPGGSLVLRFNEPVVNDPLNPFGIDLLIFGNAGYISDFGMGVTSGAMFSHSTQGRLEVSQNGSTWIMVNGVNPDGAFPTLGYQDITDPFSSPMGTVLTDFTKPVNPSFDAAGLSLAEIIAAYDGSGGGVGVDFAGTGLDWITHVRISYLGTTGEISIDALADVRAVPAPGAACALVVGGLLLARRRR